MSTLDLVTETMLISEVLPYPSEEHFVCKLEETIEHQGKVPIYTYLRLCASIKESLPDQYERFMRMQFTSRVFRIYQENPQAILKDTDALVVHTIFSLVQQIRKEIID